MTDATAGGATRPIYSNSYKALVLGMLLAAYTFNFIDRTIIATIGQAIKVDLKLTDTQLGLLGGLYFALLYTTLGIPIARWAERGKRTTIITLALVIWSGFTAMCGAAQSFAVLAALRFGVGIGEAGCSPPSHSLISDYFEPKKRASALSIYSFGIPLGTMIGAVAGGWLAQNMGWRWAFVIVGLPGLILALLFKLLVKEPPRGHSDVPEHPLEPEDLTAPAVPARAPFSIGQEFRELFGVAKAGAVRSSGSRGCSGASEWPRGGSLTSSLNRMARRMPGRPTMTKATRQLKFWASQPPATAPIIVPSGMPKA